MTTPLVEPLWEDQVAAGVRVFEHPRRKRVLYLRWRQQGNWAYKSLADAAARDGFETATLSDERGRPLSARALERKKRWAIEQAQAHAASLVAGEIVKAPAAAPVATPLTLGKTWPLISHPDTGKYPVDTPHRKDVKRELDHHIRILGDDTTWASINRAQLTKLWRTRIRQLRETTDEDEEQTVGLRTAEVTIARLLAIAQWLRDGEHIPATAAHAPKTWRQSLRSDWLQLSGEDELPEPERPRLSDEEYRKLFSASWFADPRFGLMYALGAELRGGQVKRSRRSDLELPTISETIAGAGDVDYGRFTSPGRGKKLGTVVVLTKGQRAAVDRAMDPETGYLRELEAAHRRGELKDYYLFPAGQLPGNRTARGILPVSPTGPRQSATRDPRTPQHPVATLERHTRTHIGDEVIVAWFRRAEKIAGIPSVKGRAWYGGRRVGVDLAKEAGISREGLQEHGGWSDSQIPDQTYADQKRDYAREEAAQVRSKIRGEESE